MKSLIFYFLLFCLSSCSDQTIEYFELGEFRFLTAIANLPEVDGSVSNIVSITPYISDIDAGGRTIALEIYACPDPGISNGQEAACQPSLSTTQNISYSSIHTSSLGSSFTGALPSFSVSVPAGLLTGLADDVRFNGIDFIVTMNFSFDQEHFYTYKRIKVSERLSKNTNPSINEILFSQSASKALEDKDELSITTSGNAEESYEIAKPNTNDKETLEEEAFVTWFTYQGTSAFSRTFVDEGTSFELGKEGDISKAFVAAILRDGRGGASFAIR
ncbi:MAG: hypothetical protein KDD52_00080 [Bdellovibrionales bacterium]|nr:hypothetical protein [Bdellovibrionales bacterium]